MPDLRKFTLLHWILIAIVGVILAIAVASVGRGLGLRWDPFDRTERRAEKAEGQLVTARSDGKARAIEVDGAQATTRLAEQAAADQAAAARILHRYALQLEAHDHDPETNPVPDDGADLRSVISELCGLRTTVCADAGHSAPARAAGDGPAGVSDPRPAR